MKTPRTPSLHLRMCCAEDVTLYFQAWSAMRSRVKSVTTPYFIHTIDFPNVRDYDDFRKMYAKQYEQWKKHFRSKYGNVWAESISFGVTLPSSASPTCRQGIATFRSSLRSRAFNTRTLYQTNQHLLFNTPLETRSQDILDYLRVLRRLEG